MHEPEAVFLDEAETLCDRGAIMDNARILKLDTLRALVREPGGRVPTSHRTGVPGMTHPRGTAFRAISVAIPKGFLRDEASVFFAITFPPKLLVLCGGIFGDRTSSRSDLVEIGAASLIDGLPAGAEAGFAKAFKVTDTRDRARSTGEGAQGRRRRRRRDGRKTLVAHYPQTDQVKSAVTRGTLSAFVDASNEAASGRPRCTRCARSGWSTTP